MEAEILLITNVGRFESDGPFGDGFGFFPSSLVRERVTSRKKSASHHAERSLFGFGSLPWVVATVSSIWEPFTIH